MMKGIKNFILLSGFLLFPAMLSAQNASFEVNAPEVVAVGEVFRVEFVADTAPDNFVAPSFEGVDILAGPSASVGSNVVIANGKMEQTQIYSYTYVLQRNTEGEFTIPSAAIEVGRDTYRTNPVKVKAINHGEQGGEPQSGTTAVLAPDDVLLIASVNKSRVFKGEPVRVTFKLYHNKPMADVQAAKMPAFNGFWSQQLETEGYRGRKREEYKGKIYESWVVAEYLLFPQMAGTLTIDPMSLTAVVQIITQQQRPQSIIDEFFGSSDIQEVRKALTTQPVNIQVNELPSGAPASFNGAVGEFELSHELPPASIAANSAVTYNIRLSGNGNLQQVQAPKLALPSSFEQYTVKTTESLDNSREGVYGYRQFEYPFIARAVGDYDIPSVEFSYFNPRLTRYETLASPAMKLQVVPDSVSHGGTGAMVGGLSKEDIKILGRDIRFIKLGSAHLHSKERAFLWSGLYFTIVLAIAGLSVFMFVWLRKYLADRRNSALLKGKHANKVALLRFRAAEGYMKADNQRGFYEEMLRAMWGYMGDKLNIPVANLTKENIREELVKKGVSAEQAARYITIIGDCEYAQYAPAASGRMQEAYSAGVEIVSKLESVIGKQV